MNRARSWMLVSVAAALVVGLGSGCSEFEIKNKPPVAVATAVVDGVPVMPGTAIPYNGAPVAVTLSSQGSKDEDGSIKRRIWERPGLSPNQRYAGNGMVDAGPFGPPPPPLTGDNPVVMLPEGTHRFSLWVVDNEDVVSAPSTLTLLVETPSTYMPDAACMARYSMANPNTACAECVCSPMASTGCLELYKICYENENAEFSTLCDGITKCAIAGKCVGSACFAPAPLCQTQITAAAMYMGGMLSAERCAADATDNPCAAASKLGACTNFDAMMVDGPCRSVCKF